MRKTRDDTRAEDYHFREFSVLPSSLGAARPRPIIDSRIGASSASIAQEESEHLLPGSIQAQHDKRTKHCFWRQNALCESARRLQTQQRQHEQTERRRNGKGPIGSSGATTERRCAGIPGRRPSTSWTVVVATAPTETRTPHARGRRPTRRLLVPSALPTRR